MLGAIFIEDVAYRCMYHGYVQQPLHWQLMMKKTFPIGLLCAAACALTKKRGISVITCLLDHNVKVEQTKQGYLSMAACLLLHWIMQHDIPSTLFAFTHAGMST